MNKSNTSASRNPHRRALQFERLEERALLAVLTVDTDRDITADDGLTSLREAIAIANSTQVADTIEFSSALIGETISLKQGELRITESLTINGLGSDYLKIDASESDPTSHSNNRDGCRIFHINGTDPNRTLTVLIKGLYLTGGDMGGEGGAINNFENLSVIDCEIKGNAATAGAGIHHHDNSLTVMNCDISGNIAEDRGGGIYLENSDATTVIINTAIDYNRAHHGGGIRVRSSRLAIYNTRLGDNSATGDGGGRYPYLGDGGGIDAYKSDLTIAHSVIEDGDAGRGGGIFMWGLPSNSGVESSLSIMNSTIEGNRADGRGGGIYTRNSDLDMKNVTITGNYARDDGGGLCLTGRGKAMIAHATIANNDVGYSYTNSTARVGGGIFVDQWEGGETSIDHTIVAGNSRGWNDYRDDIFGAVDAAFCLIGDNTYASITDNGGNLIGTSASPIDPLLGRPDRNGLTRFTLPDSVRLVTHALLPGSPAIDMGDPNAVPGVNGVPQFDQRGNAFSRKYGDRIDIGAFELQPPGIDSNAQVITVTTALDLHAGDGLTSLREALIRANESPDADVIEFVPWLEGATILLTHGQLSITDSVTINGLGANQLKIDASGNDPTATNNNGDGSRVFKIDDGDRGHFLNVTIRGLTITGGDMASHGGGILNRENLTIENSTITGNAAVGSAKYGGGIQSSLGNLTIVDSILRNNFSGGGGGGLYSSQSDVMITRSTIAANRAHGNGGGITHLKGDISIVDSLIVDNRANLGAGVMHDQGDFFILNTTISGNRANLPGAGVIVTVRRNDRAIIAHSTITRNASDTMGGGIFVDPDSERRLELDHTIVAGNIGGSSTAADVAGGSLGSYYSIIGIRGSTNILHRGGSRFGSSSSPIDPGLRKLEDNGGPTMTHALLAASPARNAGDPDAEAGSQGVPEFDQRGDSYSRVAGDRIDIGAFERQ